MKNLFTLLILGTLMAVTYSCEPEALPVSNAETFEESEIIDIDTYADSSGREENEQERRDPPEEDEQD